MPRWLSNVLKRIHEFAAAGEVRLTYKAQREGLLLGLSPEDVRDVTAGLGAEDSAGRLVSETTGEWMYAFKPDVGGQIIYVKLVLRENCVVVSFHEDEGGGYEEDE
ncbi:MAG: hypothetical protein A2V63_03640 [Candidatus Eisenbacteria bacterium RBG_19FT_COMBO_70_11]|nr:MAG: hypothetical protein A2V63_03640 [Candidatus Eisenbacteria bacterium RBG_19FT_COMBO_70_11]